MIRTHLYDAAGYDVSTGLAPARQGHLRWIDICGIRDHQAIADLARGLGLGDFSIAEMFHLDQRPHTDVDGGLVQTVLRMPLQGMPFRAHQITLVLGPDFVLTLREESTDCLDGVRERLAGGKGRIRSGSGYLFYALCDAIVDSFFPVLEDLGDLIEQLEERILQDGGDGVMREIHALRRDLLVLRHAVWPMREALAALQRDDAPQIDPSLYPFLRDCSDHAFQILDMVEVLRETAQGLVDLQLSTLSNKMNEVMKVLTTIATLFLPMTFIAGIYGMNFDTASPYNLPELGWRYGYVYAIGLMLASAITMLVIFWRLGWMSGKSRKNPVVAPDGSGRADDTTPD